MGLKVKIVLRRQMDRNSTQEVSAVDGELLKFPPPTRLNYRRVTGNLYKRCSPADSMWNPLNILQWKETCKVAVNWHNCSVAGVQCVSYTEVQLEVQDSPLEFSKRCQSLPSNELYEDRFVSVAYTKFKYSPETFFVAKVRAHYSHLAEESTISLPTVHEGYPGKDVEDM